MTFLILGLLILLGTHSVRVFGDGLNNTGERVGKDHAHFAGQSIHPLHGGFELTQERLCIFPVVFDETAGPVIIDHMYDRQARTRLLRQQGRTAKRPVGPLGEIRGKHDILHPALLFGCDVLLFIMYR